MYNKPGVSAKALTKRKEWYDDSQRRLKAEREGKGPAKKAAKQQPADAAAVGAQLVAAVPAEDAAL